MGWVSCLNPATGYAALCRPGRRVRKLAMAKWTSFRKQINPSISTAIAAIKNQAMMADMSRLRREPAWSQYQGFQAPHSSWLFLGGWWTESVVLLMQMLRLDGGVNLPKNIQVVVPGDGRDFGRGVALQE